MCFFKNRRADTFGTEQTGQASQRFGEPRRIAQRGFKQMKLFERRLGRFRLERDGSDRRFRRKIFKMRMQHPEKRFDIVRWLGDFKPVRITALVRRGGSVRWRIAENDFELELTRHEMERVQP